MLVKMCRVMELAGRPVWWKRSDSTKAMGKVGK